ncbi:MAG: dockerin type I repeat-containing protein [Candidatus Zixiibacteriota bacterium]
MKRTGLVLLFLIIFASIAFAQGPDPRDSIILESKTVYPGAHPGSGTDTAAYVYLKVYITNKDSLAAISLALVETSISGGAYMILSHPRNFNGTVSRLTNTLGGGLGTNHSRYHSNSPDSIRAFGVFDPLNLASIEPPNASRKAFWELKFDTVLNSAGTVELDTGTIVQRTAFTNTVPLDVPVNFVKSLVTVERKGDLNLDGIVSPADVVLELQCVYLGTVPPAGYSKCDVNCDGEVTPADVAVFLNYKFITLVWPC